MTLDERAVMRWLMLSERERSSSLFGAPNDAILRIEVLLRRGRPVDKAVKARAGDILELAKRIPLR